MLAASGGSSSGSAKENQGETSTNVVDGPHTCDDFDPEVVIETPKVGMEFNTYDDVVDYYAKFARQEGFAVCRRTSKKGRDGKMRYASVECFKGGKPREKKAKPVKPRPQSKVDCPARIRACLSVTEKLRLTFVCLEHNHDQSPGKARHFKSNRIIDEETKRKLLFHDLAGIKLNKTFDLLRIEAGGRPEDLPYLQRDCRNELAKARRLRLVEGDAEAMNSYFTRMKADNDDFFYAMDLDEEGRLRNVFWADARSRAACREFGDVLTFDTTYLVNRYDMPFAPFVSVNHHGRSVLLWCGLVSHEDTNSFIWLFHTWLTCMQNKAPNAIITDQCMAMKNAIEFVFPVSRHRWCIWHIMKKLPAKLSGYKEYRRISRCMKQAVYESLTIEEFEAAWSSFITKYDLQHDKWLDDLYVERGRWVPAFINGIFWAGMSATQRSENINGYFDGYINARTTLKQFVEQYEAALTKKVEIEKEEDATSWKTFIPCISSYDLETQFQSVYTHDKVREFQDEIRRIWDCQVWTRSNSEYEIKEWVTFGEGDDKYKKRVSYKVLFDEDTDETKCNCRLFEFRGMVCAHQLIVWNDKGIQKVPEKYVFERWCKNVKRVHSKVSISYDKSSNGIESHRRKNMCNIFKDVVELAEGCQNKYEKVMTQCRKLKQEFNEASGNDMPTNDDCGSLEDVVVPSKQNITIRDPEPARGRGRTPFKRKLGNADKLAKAKTKKAAVVGRIRKNVANKRNKRLPTNENNEGQVGGGIQNSISTLKPYMGQCTNEPSLQNYVSSQLCYMSSEASKCWNVPQVSALDQLRQIELMAESQINPITSHWRMPTFEKGTPSPYVDG